MAHAIILSKDRAAQAHLCLESLYKNGNNLFDNITVLYRASNVRFQRGYELAQKVFPKVTWYEELEYYKDVLELLDTSIYLSSFFTDDDIIYSPIHISYTHILNLMEENDLVACLSLRLGLNTRIQDPYIGSEVIVPSSGFHYFNDNNFIVWNWRECPTYTNFGYPLSVDGHIFRTNEIKNILIDCKFNNPNQQEVAMMGKINKISSVMACFPQSVLINTPLNRVQEVCMNRAGERCGQSPAEMNDKYISGYKLDFDSIDFSNIIGCHQELDIQWTMK